jgi:antitoxin component YwqK of YwqJK toxin-antitoxin module
MKKIIFIMLTLEFSMINFCKIVIVDELELKEDIYYEIDKNIPFTGVSVEYKYREKVYEDIEYKNGEPIGKWNEYHENNKIKREFEFVNGKINGQLKYYYDTGEIRIIGNLIDDKRNGIWKYYNESGILNKEETPKN